MILTAHQPVYLPWLGLFHKIALADQYVCYDHVQHSAKDYTAKNFIRTPQGKQTLIVPVQKGRSLSVTLKNLRIDNQNSWKRNHLKSIEANYRKTPFFDFLYPELLETYSKEWIFIRDLNTKLLQIFLKKLCLEREIAFSSDLNIKEDKTLGILEMCQDLGTKAIVFGEHGRDYIDESLFFKNDIKIYYQNYEHPTYKQRFKGFESHLSIIDLIFNHGSQSLDILMEENCKKEEIPWQMS